MRQAITTEYKGPTNHKGARILVKSQAGSRVFNWDHELGVEENHDAAAYAYAGELGWASRVGPNRLVGGGLPDGKGNAYVVVGPGGEQ